MFKKIIFFIAVFSNGNIPFSQTNLVANGSFEDFIPIGSQDLLPSGSLIYIYQFLDPNKYLQYDQDDWIDSRFHTLAHQIDCWETVNYESNTTDVYEESSIIVLSANQGPLVISDPNGTFSFGVPYGFEPTSYNPFGINQNVLAVNTAPTHSDTYVAMIKNRWYANECDSIAVDGGAFDLDRPKLRATLIEELVPNKTYTFSIDFQKIAHLNSYCPGGPDSPLDLENPKIKIKLYKSDGSGSFNVLGGGWTTIDHTTWENYTTTFHVHTSGYDRIEIILDLELSQNEGVFLDNVQLYDACETDLNTCENPELFKPLLNIDIHSVEFDTTAEGEPLNVKTVEVSGLKVANYAKITITNMGGDQVYDTLFIGENPPNNLMWDGKKHDGFIMPDGWYKCRVEASNLCYGPEIFIKKFKKESEIQVFDPEIYKNDWGGVTINGLNKAAFVAVSVVYVPTDDEIFYGQIAMPEDSIGWNGGGGDNLIQLTGPLFTLSGLHLVSVAIQSKCGLEIYSQLIFINQADLVASYLNGNYNDPLYQWAVVEDKITYQCDYFINDKPFYRVPKDCCVGDLYLDGDSLWGDMTFNILGTVYISDNVTTDPGSIIVINAGEGIVATPETILALGSNVSLIPSVICDLDCHKSLEINNDPIIAEKIEIDSSTILQPESLKLESVKITPNPATDFVSVLIPESKNYTNYQLFNSKGEIIFDGQVISKEFRIDISKITDGEYFIRFTSETERETVKLIVQ